jgi:F0F1-type ATP synthase assembly protein I
LYKLSEKHGFYRANGVTIPAPMQAADRPSFQPVEAGAVLIGAIGALAAVGALIGWAAGNLGYGLLAGVVVGIPAGVLTVYRRFRGYFS